MRQPFRRFIISLSLWNLQNPLQAKRPDPEYESSLQGSVRRLHNNNGRRPFVMYTMMIHYILLPEIHSTAHSSYKNFQWFYLKRALKYTQLLLYLKF